MMKFEILGVFASRNPRFPSLRHLVGWGVVSLVAVALFSAGCNREPFKYVRVSGKITYDDGTPIPADPLILTFYSETPPLDPKTHPRPGSTTVDKDTGAFSVVTSHKFNDGLVRGKHKVTLSTTNGARLPASVAGAEYGDGGKTPLEVDTSSQPFDLKVKKPAGK